MKVKVLNVRIVNQNVDRPFANLTVLKENGYATRIVVQDYQYKLSEIAKGDVYEIYVLEENKERCVSIELIKKASVKHDEAPAVTVDVETGEVVEAPVPFEEAPLPEPPADYPADKAKNKK